MNERTLVLVKPDALQRNLLGEIIHRFERKGLKVIGLKMIQLNAVLLEDHYEKHKDKDFFQDLSRFMSSSPVVAMVLEGPHAISAVRLIVGPTKGFQADAGSIRGDYSLSGSANVVHASDPEEDPEGEINRFFTDDELFDYRKIDYEFITGEVEKKES